jgi:hypothetical protein
VTPVSLSSDALEAALLKRARSVSEVPVDIR